MSRRSNGLGKKIDKIVIAGKAKRYEVDLRFDRDTGRFQIDFEAGCFVGTDLAAIKAQAEEAARQLEALVFTWWIEMSFTVHSKHHRFEDGEDPDPDVIVHGYELNFNVVERCEPFRDTGDTEPDDWATLECAVEPDENGVLVAEGNHRRSHLYVGYSDREKYKTKPPPQDGFPYTPERYAVLMQARQATRDLVLRLWALFKNDKAAMATLDSAPANILMLAAAPAAPAKMGRRAPK